MDTTDRSESKLPVPFTVASSPSLLSRPASNGELAIAPAPQFDSSVLKRGLARHWCWILLLWLGFSVPVACLIYRFVEPTYEAISRILIEPSQPNLFDSTHTSADLRTYEPYLQTQVDLITGDRVLNKAIANERVVKLRMITGSKDPKTDLREKMVVDIVPNTYLIKVALQSPDPEEAAEIVNAVVASYLDENKRYTATRDTTLKTSLAEQLSNLKEQIERTKQELQKLHQKGNVQVSKPLLNVSASKNEDEGVQPTFNSVEEQQMNAMIAAMVQNDIDLLTAQADLKARLEIQKGQQDAGSQAQQQTDSDLEERVKEAFLNDPEVIALSNQMNEIEDQLDHHKAVIRKRSDPAQIAAKKQLDKLKKEYDDLWGVKAEQLRKRLRMAIDGRPAAETIGELQHRIKMLLETKDGYAQMFQKLEVKQKATNDDSFKFAYTQQQLTSLLNREEQVIRTHSQVVFQSQQEQFRVSWVGRAEVPKVASNNKRLKYMAAAPVGVLFMLLGLFLLLEIKAERVADPDALSTRVRSKVYALPPLPKPRELRRRNDSTLNDQIEQFKERLDHLRFAVCGNSVQPGKGRCVLITSAIEQEGKTTLAAQLAARCGIAGMSTLLIDADLRRGALCALLDVPEGLGLSDVLKGQCRVEDVVTPVQGDAFRLLCAGTPIQDVSALLQDRPFGMLITELRQLYDLIIIDSPPVLPVPDALILGRWSDGAILAARYDRSKSPQLERARGELHSAGIAVIGTVINGLRHSESYYGRYAYSRRRSPETDSSSTI